MTTLRDDGTHPGWHFVAGAIFGSVIGWWSVLSAHGLPEFIAGIVVGGLLGGVLSVRFGARFWEAVRHLVWFDL